MIGHDIVVTVLEVRGDQVRLGIKAPRSIDVHREEIFVQLQQANRDAVAQSGEALHALTEVASDNGNNALPSDNGNNAAPSDNGSTAKSTNHR
jgi:carbon storage regulator